MRDLAGYVLAGSLALGGCLSPTGSNPDTTIYALHRIGADVLPAPSDPDPASSLILADTLFVPHEVGTPAGAILTHVRLSRFSNDPPVREVQRLAAVREGDALLVNECPVDYFCIASLVAASTMFLISGDSLFEQVEAGSARLPRVYGRVPVRPRE